MDRTFGTRCQGFAIGRQSNVRQNSGMLTEHAYSLGRGNIPNARCSLLSCAHKQRLAILANRQALVKRPASAIRSVVELLDFIASSNVPPINTSRGQCD